jgi:hypothetical protein
VACQRLRKLCSFATIFRMRKFMALHRNVRVRIGLAFVHKLIDAMIFTFIAIYLASR